MQIPSMGLGTFRLKEQEVVAAVSTGLELGYRHIDTAQIYDNEAEVGRALAESGVPRGEVFLTTKIWTEHLAPGRLIPSLEASLAKLQTEQVDLTLIHWPSPRDEIPVAVYMEQLAEARARGLTRHIGVSNFTVRHLQAAIDAVGADAILTNQVELHPLFRNEPIVEFCRARGIRVTAYMPLAYGKVLEEPVLQAIGAAHGVSPASVALAWLLQEGHIAIPASTRRSHLQANLDAAGLRLGEAELARVRAIATNQRLVSPDFGPAWD